MELSLRTFFDLGISYGLEDDVFRDCGAGEVNPFGSGFYLDLTDRGPYLLSRWREAAARKVYEEDMEIGYSLGKSHDDCGPASTEAEFKSRLNRLIKTHRI